MRDFGLLIKLRLSTMVVFSSVLAFAIVAPASMMEVNTILQLIVGGFFITAAANAMNEVLEKDYDRQMTRTMNRPVAADRMSVSAAVLLAGLMAVTGMITLAYINPLAAFLGTLAFVLYAFVYTPMKRFSTWAIPVGAIPGAMPVLIGCVAAEGTISILAIALFSLQFLWQFPHFWAIGFLGYSDYKKAGYNLLPEKGAGIDQNLGLYSSLYSVLMIPVSLVPFMYGINHWFTAGLLVICGLALSWLGFRLFRNPARKEALQLMFGSIAYLPLSFILIWIG